MWSFGGLCTIVAYCGSLLGHQEGFKNALQLHGNPKVPPDMVIQPVAIPQHPCVSFRVTRYDHCRAWFDWQPNAAGQGNFGTSAANVYTSVDATLYPFEAEYPTLLISSCDISANL